MEKSANRVEKALRTIIEEGFQLSPEAFDALRKSRDPYEVVTKVLGRLKYEKKKPIVIGLEHLKPFLGLEAPPAKKVEAVTTPMERAIEVLKEPWLRGIRGETVEDYINFFNSKFRRMRLLFRERPDTIGSLTIKEAKRREGEKVKVIAMVGGKREAKTGLPILLLEDLEDQITAVIPKDSNAITKSAKILLDEVICVEGMVRGGMLIVTDIVWVDVSPKARKTKSGEITYAVLVSDLHIGNALFAQEAFENFLAWMNGESGDVNSDKLAEKVKYLLIAGDLVDGVGVYPGQEEELAIKDVEEQYRLLAKMLQKVPSSVSIIIVPGDHDASRSALPRPPIYEEIAKPLYNLSNVRMLGDPVYLRIQGVEVLLTHGETMDDIIASIPGMSYSKPEEALVELLRKRHLAPTFGRKVLVAPSISDPLILEKVPDLICAGHAHVASYTEYKGVVVLVTGCWIHQTELQKKQGIKPAVGVALLIDLQSLKITKLSFT
ncbi:MAG: DNA-directed DNA polymerase II small subunit [Candidatus Nezhaarchaeales archaeon]